MLLVLVFVFNFDLFKFSAAILEKGLLRMSRISFTARPIQTVLSMSQALSAGPISFPEPRCLLVSTKTRSSGIINKLVPRALTCTWALGTRLLQVMRLTLDQRNGRKNFIKCRSWMCYVKVLSINKRRKFILLLWYTVMIHLTTQSPSLSYGSFVSTYWYTNHLICLNIHHRKFVASLILADKW